MVIGPKSLTAIVHLRLHYNEKERKVFAQGELELLGQVMDQASELDPELQELLVKFGHYIIEHRSRING